MPQLLLYSLLCIGFNNLPKVCTELVSKELLLWGWSHVPWDVGQERAEKERHEFQICSYESWNWYWMWWGSNSSKQHELFFLKLSVAVETDNIVSTVESGSSLVGAVAIILLWASFPERAPVLFGIRLLQAQEGAQHSQLFCYPWLFAKLKWVYLLLLGCV